MKSILSILLIVMCAFSVQSLAFDFSGAPADWVYDEGPNPDSEMGKELIDLNANIPSFPVISEQLMGSGKFRAPFGPIPWRMQQKPNSVKILFIGQDGTHIAEAAGRPATAGFGGRAHDLANHFGVDYSAGFINTYAFTIYGQYGDYGIPYVYDGNRLDFTRTFLTNELWMLSQDQMSPITQWRNDLIEWIIRNNRESLKMIVTFGGSAKDTISSFIVSRGGFVDTNTSNDFVKKSNVRVVKYSVENAGGNFTFPVPVDAQGNDLYKKLYAKKAQEIFANPSLQSDYNYKPINDRDCKRSQEFKNSGMSYENFKSRKIKEIASKSYLFPVYKKQYRECDPMDQQNLIKKLVFENPNELANLVVFQSGGMNNSGVINPAQLGGYNMNQIYVEDKNGDGKKDKSISIKGLKLEKGAPIQSDILVVDLPHPTNLSNIARSQGNEEVARRVAQKIAIIDRWKKFDANGDDWEIKCDAEVANCNSKGQSAYTQGMDFEYGRGDIGQEFYDFGTPGNRMVAKSDAKRLNAYVILLGARDDPYFYKGNPELLNDNKSGLLDKMVSTKPNSYPSAEEMYIAMSRTPEERVNFDAGPGEEFAKLMKNNLNVRQIVKEKPGMEWGFYNAKKRKFTGDGNAATNVKSHPAVKDFGHYRGTFKKPKVVILADPQGWDDIMTARALTGKRGQFLQGLMEDLGVSQDYLVLKTVPFGMEGASSKEWNVVLKQTDKYRQEVLSAVLAQGGTNLIMTDGKYAAQSMDSFLKKNPQFKLDTINIKRTNNDKTDMQTAARALSDKYSRFSGIKAKGQMANIPGSHLSYYARVWEGTSGDRVMTAQGKTAGLAFAEVVPSWAAKQKVQLKPEVQNKVDKIKTKLCDNGYTKHCN